MGRKPQYIVNLTASERKKLLEISRDSDTSRTVRFRANILIEADIAVQPVLNQKQIAIRAGTTPATVSNIIRKFGSEGLEAVLNLKRSPNSDRAKKKTDGRTEAIIIAKACTSPPDGRVRWTVSLLKEECEELLDQSISRATVHRILVKNELHPHKNKYWSIPPEEDAAFIACMEDVLEEYEKPYDSEYPLICMDEKPKEIHGQARDPLPAKPGKDKIEDSEYVRNGHACVFVFTNPNTGWIEAHVSERRTKKDWAREIKWLVDEAYPEAKKIRLVMDNLNTHTISSLYSTFPPAEARRIARKLEIHYTPKHGSWLNIAEIAIHILSVECLNRRIESYENLEYQVNSWNTRRESTKAINWQFTVDDARTKLHHLYPKLNKD